MAQYPEESELISKILNETFEGLSDSSISTNKGQLKDYFIEKESNTKKTIQEMDINNFCLKSGLQYKFLRLDKYSSCYELVENEIRLFIPKNWGLFNLFSFKNQTKFLKLEKTSSLWKVLNRIMPDAEEFLFCYLSPNLYLMKGKTLTKSSIGEFNEKLKTAA